MSLTLESGKWYWTRDGEIVKLQDSSWTDAYSASNGLVYDGILEGKQVWNQLNPYDLVAEAEAPTPSTDYSKEALEFMQRRHGPKVETVTSHADYLAFLEETFTNLIELIRRKNLDYTAGQDDAFANFRRSEPKVKAIDGAWVRWGDKVNRVDAYFKRGKLEVQGEGLEDALLDTIGYSAILLALLKEYKGDEHI
jgi:hypothetical protein